MKKLSDYIYPHYREHGATSIKKVSEVIIFFRKADGIFSETPYCPICKSPM